jgi:hypothetical protein
MHSAIKRCRSVVPVICVVCVTAIVAASHLWQEGTWRDTNRLSSVSGALSNGTINGGNVSGATMVTHRVYQQFVIETETHLYVAQQRLRWRWSKPVPMTVNAPMKYAIEKDSIYVIGEDKKEYELDIVKKILKETAATARH